MLFDDDVMAYGKPEPGALTRRLGGEERVEHSFFDVGRDAGAIVADPDLDAIAEIPGRRDNRRLEIGAVGLRLALVRGVKTIGNEWSRTRVTSCG